jgi:hypothetical protein
MTANTVCAPEVLLLSLCETQGRGADGDMSESRDDTRRADAGRDDAGQDGGTPRDGANNDQEFSVAGFGHALHLLLMAIAKTNAAVGPLLDEFTAKHADYLRELQGAGGGEPAQATDNFILASRLIYKRLSDLQTRQAAARSDGERAPAAARLH